MNPAVVPTGCNEHANRYSIYAMDSRQVIHALAGEPRFLSIAPDMGLVDLTVADDLTYPDIKLLSRAYANNSTLSGIDDTQPNVQRISFLTVTSTWFQSTFVANGIIRHDQDGIITDYPESTGIWSTHILNKYGVHDIYPQGCGSNPLGGEVKNVNSAKDYNICIDAAIRQQEAEFMNTTESSNDFNESDEVVGSNGNFEFCKATTTSGETTNVVDGGVAIGSKSCFYCQSRARYGTDKSTARFSKVLTACQLEDLMIAAGVTDDLGGPKFKLQGCSL